MCRLDDKIKLLKLKDKGQGGRYILYPSIHTLQDRPNNVVGKLTLRRERKRNSS